MTAAEPAARSLAVRIGVAAGLIALLVGVIVLALALHDDTLAGGTIATQDAPPLDFRLVTGGLDEPVDATALPEGMGILVVERAGTVRLIEDGELRPDAVLDIRHAVLSDNIERGLVGIAVHPEFAVNGRVFLTYTALDGSLLLTEFASTRDPVRFDPASERVVLRVEQESIYHHGGSIRFGPDGYLWIGLGDGGGARRADPLMHGINPHTLQATVSRIDVDRGDPYAIPPSNPFAGAGGGAPEVWAYGFRNPWRMTFDDGWLYVADVGQARYDEVDVVALDDGGRFFGWSLKEGPECFRLWVCAAQSGGVAPSLSVFHDGFCAIVGGPVYRGSAVPELAGSFFYADFCSGAVESVRFEDGAPVEHHRHRELGSIGHISSFFVDELGEMYVLQMARGEILQIVPAT